MGKALAGLAILLAAGLLWMARAPDRSGVHISGDGAPDLIVVLDARGVPLAATPGAAATEVVLLRRWSRLAEHLPDLARLCREVCDGRSEVVILREPRPNGRRTVILHDIGAADAGAGAALDTGAPVPAKAFACILPLLDQPAGDAVDPDAAPDIACEVTRKWRLPFGL